MNRTNTIHAEIQLATTYDQIQSCYAVMQQLRLIEGVNCILRQRVSRLVRKTVAFSKLFVNHMGAIRYFVCHYNQRAYERFLEKLDLVDCVIS